MNELTLNRKTIKIRGSQNFYKQIYHKVNNFFIVDAVDLFYIFRLCY